ncbi:hypothetical protein PV377_21235 [Streptomyces ipomoeae]|nr:hypothetical protein [Streptomyces ipomoeae]MDX2841465.1 hypothetical protein [Streptomyces ipomoeae]
MSRLLSALLMGVCAAVIAYISGVSGWAAVVVGVVAAGLSYALTTP